jgi:transglutaminase-like putative cysteine protease
MNKHLAFLFAALTCCGTSLAAAGEPLDLATRFGRYYINIDVHEDGTAVESAEWSMTVLKESALDQAKHASVGYSTSAQKAEVVAAYTLKADGHRIDVPKDNYQMSVNRGKGQDSPVYSDRTTLTVVFPDVAVGDSVVFSYQLTQTEPMFPKHYSTTQFFTQQIAYDDVQVRIDYPASLWVQYQARGMTEAESATKNDRRIVEWRYANPKPVKSERQDYSVFDPDKEVGYAFSTFRNYAEVAQAYGERAQPKAVPTERIRQLAGEIVGSRNSPKEQAHALYEWVATHITYAGNCIGVGAVVPRDLSFVLDNKMGDCKDHATLLQALLAAQDISSTQALVNAGSTYRLPTIPVVSMVNHVINYLPDWDLYVDSTSDATPFGMLPFGDQGKPVLHVQAYRDGTRTPVPAIGSNREHTRTMIKIAADGSMSGSVEVVQHGESAARARAWARQMSKDVEDDLIKNMFRSQGAIGSGRLEKDDPAGLLDTYRYKVSLNGEKYLRLPGSGAFYIYPPLGIGSSLVTGLDASHQTEKETDVQCRSTHLTEEYVIELPKKLKVLSIPADIKVANDFASYTGTYKLNNNVLTAKRVFDDRTRGNVCSPQVMDEFKKVAERTLDNVKEQVLYK